MDFTASFIRSTSSIQELLGGGSFPDRGRLSIRFDQHAPHFQGSWDPPHRRDRDPHRPRASEAPVPAVSC